jgi:hypothetical protein
MKFFKFSILVVFVLVVLGGIAPLHKADAQVFTSVCGYNESNSTDIICTYEVKIEEGNTPPAYSTIHSDFIFLGSTDNLVGNPTFVSGINYGELYTYYPNACNGSACYQRQYTTDGNGGVIELLFKWETSYGVYEYTKSMLYTVNGSSGSNAYYTTINANPVNTSSGDVAITFFPTVARTG